MLNDTDLDAAIDGYEGRTQRAIAAARKLKLPKPAVATFCTARLTKQERSDISKLMPSLTAAQKKSRSSGFLYVFRQEEGCVVARADILAAIRKAKAGDDNSQVVAWKNLCALNESALDGKALYVGRSWDPRTRISEHLRASTSSTYAIHFEAWATELAFNVEVFVYEFPDVDHAALQVMEDALWDRLQPLFGKRGDK